MQKFIWKINRLLDRTRAAGETTRSRMRWQRLWERQLRKQTASGRDDRRRIKMGKRRRMTEMETQRPLRWNTDFPAFNIWGKTHFKNLKICFFESFCLHFSLGVLVTFSHFPSTCCAVCLSVRVCACLCVFPKQVCEGGDPVSVARFLGFSVVFL